MKLALVSDALDPTNGWGHHAVQVARGLIARGVDVRLVSPRAQAAVPDLRAFPDQADIPSFQQGVRHPVRLLLAALPRLRAAFRGADAVHVIVEPYAPAAVLAAGRRPVFVSLAGTYARPSSRPG
ncbi:MAG: glycosyltransferase, partial [Actinobacteria bacterium]|nr:glycosyltransferase [Actinomycetota bacterium]